MLRSAINVVITLKVYFCSKTSNQKIYAEYWKQLKNKALRNFQERSLNIASKNLHKYMSHTYTQCNIYYNNTSSTITVVHFLNSLQQWTLWTWLWKAPAWPSFASPWEPRLLPSRSTYLVSANKGYPSQTKLRKFYEALRRRRRPVGNLCRFGNFNLSSLPTLNCNLIKK